MAGCENARMRDGLVKTWAVSWRSLRPGRNKTKLWRFLEKPPNISIPLFRISEIRGISGSASLGHSVTRVKKYGRLGTTGLRGRRSSTIQTSSLRKAHGKTRLSRTDTAPSPAKESVFLNPRYMHVMKDTCANSPTHR